MKRRIIGFHQDESLDWVADLDCGHQQHVRHNPPWMNRPWMMTPDGRKNFIGSTLNCKLCDENESDVKVMTSNPGANVLPISGKNNGDDDG